MHPKRQEAADQWSDPGIKPAIEVPPDSCPVALIALDLQGNTQVWNQAAETLFGWSAAETVGHRPPMLTVSGYAQFAETVETRLHERPYDDLPLRWATRSGVFPDLSVRISNWMGSARERRGTLLMISEAGAALGDGERALLVRRETEAREQASASLRFRELLEAAPDAIVEVDESGRILLMNAVTESLFGYTREELVGQPVEILIPQAFRGSHVAKRTGYWHKPVTRPMGRGLTLYALRKDGSQFPVEISLSPVHSDQGVRVAAIIRDVTERKRIEDNIRSLEQRFSEELAAKNIELERRNQEVERADRLKSEFLASMSHELRTPLHTIIGFSELLAEEIQGPLNEKQRRFVDHIHRDSKHLLELINDILDLSKIESGRVELRRETFEANVALEEVAAGFRPTAAAKSLRLETIANQPQQINADRVRFKEVLYNLIGNAIKFTPSGGSIKASIGDCGEAGFCTFTVDDTGVGIAQDQLQAIFDRFYQVGSTTKGVREGTGLGLAITRHIVELHGGSIEAQSAPGRGSRFTFTMPCGAP
jgi:PAS domain S-box-containing protein